MVRQQTRDVFIVICLQVCDAHMNLPLNEEEEALQRCRGLFV